MRRLEHQNVVFLKDAVDDFVAYHIVLEYCPGGELYYKLLSQRKFSEHVSGIVMVQILEAVHYIHMQGLCHRDVKLENFVFLRDGPVENNVLKLIDFGLAVRCGPEDRLREKVGTPNYAAPEVLNGPHYNQKVDEWSCGVIMYAMLSGKLPFGAKHSQQVLSKVRAAEFDFAHVAWTLVTSEAQSLIRGLLTKNVEDRLTALQALDDVWFGCAI